MAQMSMDSMHTTLAAHAEVWEWLEFMLVTACNAVSNPWC
jgi:hypothetical protein